MSRTEENFKAAVKSILLEQGVEPALNFIKARHIPEPEDFLFKHFGVTYLRNNLNEDTLEDVEDDIPIVAPIVIARHRVIPSPDEPPVEEPLDLETDVDILVIETNKPTKKSFLHRMMGK